MIFQTLFLNPLGPSFVLFLGGLIAMLGRRLTYRAILRPGSYGLRVGATARIKPILSHFRMPFAALVLALAAVALVLLRLPTSGAVVRWTWQPLTVAGSALEWRLDTWSWLVSGLLLALTAVALLLATPELIRSPDREGAEARRSPRLDEQGTEWERTLWLAAAALAFVCSNNVLTLATTWVVLDAALSFRLRPSGNPAPSGRTWGLLSLAALLPLLALTLLGESGIRTTLADPEIDRLTLGLLWLSGLIRAGVYPLHFWLSGPGRLDRSDAVALSLIAPLTGVWLLVRLHVNAGPDWLRRPEWAALGALALLGTALVAWAADDESHRWRWIAMNRAGLVVMTAYTVGGSDPHVLVWSALAFVLGCALLALGQALCEQGWRAPVWLAALALWGLPGTTGFLARKGLVFPTELPIAALLFGIMLLAEVLLAAALWQAAGGPSGLPRVNAGRTLALGLAFAVLLVGSVGLGLFPRWLAAVANWTEGEAIAAFGDLLAGTRRSVWAGLIISGGLGSALGLLRGRLFAQMRGWQRGIAAIASLEWLYQAVGIGFSLGASGLQYFATLGEGEGYLGWLALASLILWVLLRG